MSAVNVIIRRWCGAVIAAAAAAMAASPAFSVGAEPVSPDAAEATAVESIRPAEPAGEAPEAEKPAIDILRPGTGAEAEPGPEAAGPGEDRPGLPTGEEVRRRLAEREAARSTASPAAESESGPPWIEEARPGLPTGADLERKTAEGEEGFPGRPAEGEGQEGVDESRAVFEPVIRVEVVSLLTRNDDGDPFGYPNAVFCDREMDETFVVTSGEGGRIIVYNENYFPVFSLGAGRGAIAPRDIEKDAAGRFYIAQSATEDRPPCVSVFNAALFKERDIGLDQSLIEDIDGGTFVPQSLAVAPNERIYLTLSNVRGVMVLNTDGTFSHWLRPMDMVYAAGPVSANEEEEEKAAGDEEQEFDIDLSTLPEELRPRRIVPVPAEEVGPKLGPVLVNSVRIDSNGNIFVLSGETSKVYVFNSDEEMLFSFGEKGGAEGKMSQPRDLVIDESRNSVYIADYMRHTVLIFDRSGRFMYEFGGQGNAPGWFQFPVSLALDGQGHLLVSDLFNMRVQVLNVDFRYTFPLFRVPFVQEESFEPQPISLQERMRYYAPGGFDPGGHASTEGEGPGERDADARHSVM